MLTKNFEIISYYKMALSSSGKDLIFFFEPLTLIDTQKTIICFRFVYVERLR